MYPLWLCIIGTATLWVAMWYFWFTFDRSQWWKRALWCFVYSLAGRSGHPSTTASDIAGIPRYKDRPKA